MLDSRRGSTIIDPRLATKYVLQCLHSETGSYGGGAKTRVKKFIDDPYGADSIEFGYVSGLNLSRFYVDPSKPNAAEIQGLWSCLKSKFDKREAPMPASINAKTTVRSLRNMINEA